MKYFVVAMLLFMSFHQSARAQTIPTLASVNLDLIPAVQQWKPGPGVLNMPEKLVICFNPADVPALAHVAGILREDLNAAGFPDVEIKQGEVESTGDIILAIDPNVAAGNRLAKQAYQLSVEENVHIAATTPDGVFYGTRTLLQLLKTTKESWPAGPLSTIPATTGEC